jgi:hypothetical protein
MSESEVKYLHEVMEPGLCFKTQEPLYGTTFVVLGEAVYSYDKMLIGHKALVNGLYVTCINKTNFTLKDFDITTKVVVCE